MAEQTKPNIREYSKEDLVRIFEEMGEKPFRAKILHKWLWEKSSASFAEMTDLPAGIREKLEASYLFNPLTVSDLQKSKDGTIKSGFQLHDGQVVEGVLIPTKKRMTACVSSQVGCSLSCAFCATGFMDRMRNLSPFEIYDQVVAIRNQAEDSFQRPLTNIVFMGMGEPLLNYNNTLAGIEKITSPEGLGMSPKRITVSTAGIAKMIHRLADDNVKFNLALSLHAADDEKRSSIMPINEQNNIEVLMESLFQFHVATNNKITFEYILFKDFNDSLEDAERLFELCKKLPIHINLIEYNTVENTDFKKPDEEKVDKFQQFLEKRGVTAKVRRSRGRDIDAACGQLANKK